MSPLPGLNSFAMVRVTFLHVCAVLALFDAFAYNHSVVYFLLYKGICVS